MIQVTVDHTNLNKEQRDAFANFMLAYLGYDAVKDTKVVSTTQEALEEVTAAFGKPDIVDINEAVFIPAPPASPTPAPAPIVNSSVELDSEGLPWDARIHVESKNKLASGAWKKKRQLEAAFVKQVESELRQVLGAPATVTAAPPPPPVETLAIPSFLKKEPQPAMPPAPETHSLDGKQKYMALIARTSSAVAASKITLADVAATCSQFGVPALPLLANRLDLVDSVASAIDALIASR